MEERRLVTREQLDEVYELGKRHERAMVVGCLRAIGYHEAAEAVEIGSHRPVITDKTEWLRNQIAQAESLLRQLQSDPMGDGGFSHHVDQLKAELAELEK
jgi:hypothetical protein